jgi:membrane protease YdiL (CAAX protease family)
MPFLRGKLFWTALLVLAALLLWRVAMMASAEFPMPFAHGARLTFGMIVSAGIVGFSIVMLRLRARPATWVSLDGLALAQVGLGTAVYAGLASVSVGILVLAGMADVNAPGSPDTVLKLAYLLVLVLLSEALPEELLFRGWLMDALGSGRSPWRPVLGQAAVFTLFAWAIGSLNSLQDASFIACFGLVLGIVRAVTGSIWAPVGVHLAFIATQQSALPQWAIWAGDPHPLVQSLGLAIVPFSVIVAILFGRVRPRSENIS